MDKCQNGGAAAFHFYILKLLYVFLEIAYVEFEFMILLREPNISVIEFRNFVSMCVNTAY